MVIIATLVILFLIFFLLKHHTGPAHLAMIAGLSVYDMFGVQFADWLHQNIPNIPLDVIKTILYLAFILVFPLLMYLRSRRGGLRGILRIIEAAIFAIIMTALLAAPLAKYLPFDTLSGQIATFIANIEGPLVLVGIISAYIDILFYRNRD